MITAHVPNSNFYFVFSTHELFLPKLFHRPNRNNVSQRAGSGIQCQLFLVWFWLCRYLPLHPLGCRQGPDLADSGSIGAQYIRILRFHSQDIVRDHFLPCLSNILLTPTMDLAWITIALTSKISTFCTTINFEKIWLLSNKPWSSMIENCLYFIKKNAIRMELPN